MTTSALPGTGNVLWMRKSVHCRCSSTISVASHGDTQWVEEGWLLAAGTYKSAPTGGAKEGLSRTGDSGRKSTGFSQLQVQVPNQKPSITAPGDREACSTKVPHGMDSSGLQRQAACENTYIVVYTLPCPGSRRCLLYLHCGLDAGIYLGGHWLAVTHCHVFLWSEYPSHFLDGWAAGKH